MLLMIDNYDSFTYNLVQYFGELGEDVQVYRNDEITVEQVAALKPDHIVISPGPCTPNEAGISVPLIQAIRRQGAAARRVPRPPEHRPGVRRQDHPRQAAHARQDLADPPQGRGRVQGPAQPLHRHALPLAGDRARNHAGLPGNHRLDRRRRDHGRAPQDPGGGRRAVPSRIHPDRTRPRRCWPTSSRRSARDYAQGRAHPADRTARDFPRRDAVADAPDHERGSDPGADRRPS